MNRFLRRTVGSLMGFVLVIALPLAGAALVGREVTDYLEFPPLTRHVAHAPFSWPFFILLAFGIAAALFPFLRRAFTHLRPTPIRLGPEPAIRNPQSAIRTLRFPWWGWLGFGVGAAAWILAWNRFPWFESLQSHTFAPLWFSYILVVNAVVRMRSGECPLTRQPARYLALFPLSAGFWWLFEFLNRFVQNWWYQGVVGFSPVEYVLFASVSFSTVLPAVSATAALLGTFGRLTDPFADWQRVRMPAGATAIAVFICGTLGTAGLGIWPDYLFPLVWVAPLLLALAIGGRPLFAARLECGDWRPVVCWTLAALVCGFFWEMWNFFSLARWIYAVPFVNRFHLFEMPVLGYAGYLPFGLECAVVAGWLLRDFEPGTERLPSANRKEES